jgi:hypothetical protein
VIPNHAEGANRLGRGRTAPLIVLASTLVCLAQLRHIEIDASGGLVWGPPMWLVLASLALANGAVWWLYRQARRLEERLAREWG